MVDTSKKRPLFSHRAKIFLAIAIIAIVVVLAIFFAPPEGESNNVTGDPATTPTVSITNLVASVTVNRATTLQGVHLTVISVMEASKFSDDRKRSGAYTIRVSVQTHNDGALPVGVDYASLVRLSLPDGTMIAPKYISVKPVSLPKSIQLGYFDFPITTQLPLAHL